jgi:hypothetical protein
MSYLISIPQFEDENFPGLLPILVARKDDIETYPEQRDGIAVSPLVFKAGKDFVEWVSSYDTANFISTSEQSQEGVSKRQELPFILPKNSLTEVMLNKAERDEFIVLIQDRNGFKYLFGSLDKPVRFQYDKNSGATGSRNQYDCRFFSDTYNNVLIYPPDFDIETDFSAAPPVVVRRGSIDGPILAVAPAGSTVVITSPYSFGYQLIAT